MASLSQSPVCVPRVMAFDIGRVLIQYDPYILLRQVINDDEKIAFFLENVCDRDFCDRLDNGEDRATLEAQRKAAFPEYAPLLDAMRERWIETVPGLIPGTSEILFELKAKGYPIYAITNFGVPELEQVTAKYPSLQAFDGRIVSAAEHLIKPDPAIFNLFLSRYNYKPEEVVFTDDLPRNIAGARSVGIQGIVFENAEQLRRDLKALGMPLD